MSSPIGIGAPGAPIGPTFEQPFEMLEACHDRVERMLALLEKMRSHMRAQGADEQVRQAARDVMRYFDMAAPQHHRDEELHVFPALVALQDEELVRLVAKLHDDHARMEAQWPAARSLLEEVESGMRTRFNEADDAMLDAFAGLYASHIDTEESTAFPRASASMERERLQAMSQDMMARRGVK
jgi:hemerythrin-like domain-containing protein